MSVAIGAPSNALRIAGTAPAIAVPIMQLTPAALMQALRERIDPIFLPRPLLFVDALPRNAMGKLPHQLAQALLASLQAKTSHGLPA